MALGLFKIWKETVMIDRTVSRIYQDIKNLSIFNHKQLSSEIQLKTWKSHNLFLLYVVCGLIMQFDKESKECKLHKKFCKTIMIGPNQSEMNCPVQASNYQLINHFPYFFFTTNTYLMKSHLKAKHLFLLYCTVAEWCNTKLKYLTFYNFHFSEIFRFEFSKTSRKV